MEKSGSSRKIEETSKEEWRFSEVFGLRLGVSAKFNFIGGLRLIFRGFPLKPPVRALPRHLAGAPPLDPAALRLKIGII